LQVKASMIAAIRRFQPHVVMSWWPYPRFEMKPSQGWGDLGYHPDHQVRSTPPPLLLPRQHSFLHCAWVVVGCGSVRAGDSV
jgi:hypothetical protein